MTVVTITNCYGWTMFKLDQIGQKCYFWNVGCHLGYHSNEMKRTNQKPQIRSHDLVHLSLLCFRHLGLSMTFMHSITDESRTKTGQKQPTILLMTENSTEMDGTKTNWIRIVLMSLILLIPCTIFLKNFLSFFGE